MRMQRQLVWALAVALGTSAPLAACVRGDVILGERGANPTAAPRPGVSDTVSGVPSDAGSVVGSGPAVAAAGSGNSPLQMTQVSQNPVMMVNDEDASTHNRTGRDASLPIRAARPSAGCGKPPLSLDTTISVTGMLEKFLLDMPPGYEPSRGYALVLAFRGMSHSAEQFRDELALRSVLGPDAVIVHTNPLDAGDTWDLNRDMPLVDTLIDTLGTSLCIDLDRVFAVGHEEGALFVNMVGCVRAKRVRAVALLSAAPPPFGPCMGNIAASLMQRADADFMTVGNGFGNRDFWASRNGCDVRMPLPIAPPACVEYANCSKGRPVRYCEYDGEALPSFATEAIAQFFQAL